MGRYVVGSALTTKLPSFHGTGDLYAYLRTFERLAKAHTIADPTARNRHKQKFPDPGTLLSKSCLTSSMHGRFGLKYVAADAWAYKCWATQQTGESGLAAIQRVDELKQNLALLGVPAHVGPFEERCYHLQRMDATSSSTGSLRQTPPRTTPMVRFALWRPPLLRRPSAQRDVSP